MNLIATFPADRHQLGTLKAMANGSLLASWSAYGKADDAEAARFGNPSRNPLQRFGDTPVGMWKVTLGKVNPPVETYGPNPVLMLWPLSGQALASHGPDRRRAGIWVHGGDLNAAGGLRPTYGCVRVANETMAAILALSAIHGPIETLETREA